MEKSFKQFSILEFSSNDYYQEVDSFQTWLGGSDWDKTNKIDLISDKESEKINNWFKENFLHEYRITIPSHPRCLLSVSSETDYSYTDILIIKLRDEWWLCKIDIGLFSGKEEHKKYLCDQWGGLTKLLLDKIK